MSRKNIEAIYPLSSVQQGMLYETIARPGSGIYVEQFICVLTGDLDLSIWQQTWESLVQHHTIMRTCFIWESQPEPLQVVLRQTTLPFHYQDWSNLSPLEQSQRLENFLREDRRQGFKLARAPLVRLAIWKTANEVYQMVWSYHHILLDGWSSALVMQEVLTSYYALHRGEKPQLATSYPYEQYISWLKQQDNQQAEHFWRSYLSGVTQASLPGRLALPIASNTGPELSHTQTRRLSAQLTTQVQTVVRQQHVTLNTLLQGIWAILLARYNSTQEVIFGSTVSGRPVDLPGSEKIIGPCINTLPLHATVDPACSFWDWLKHLQESNFELRQYEHTTSSLLQQWSAINGSQRLYESLLVVENYPLDLSLFHSEALSVSHIHTQGAQTSYAFTLLITLQSELELTGIYNTQRLDQTAVTQLLEHVTILLWQLVEHPDPTIAQLQEQIPETQIPVVYAPPQVSIAAEEANKPGTSLEEKLRAIWQEVLGKKTVNLHDNFFASGGYSLSATQLVARMRATLQIEIPLRSLFEHPTIAELATFLEQDKQKGQARQQPAITSVSRAQTLPLSFAQQRLWFLSQVEPESATYNVTIAIRLRGEISGPLLERSLSEIVRRHENLRITIHADQGQPFQIVASSYQQLLAKVDLSDTPEELQAVTFKQLAEAEALIPFNLATGPLLRTTLVSLQPSRSVLLVTIHHIVSDAWSVGVFVRELNTLYQAFALNQPVSLPELDIQYADFAVWQRQWLQGEALKRLVTYWTKQLEGASPLKLPTHQNLELADEAQGAVIPFAIAPELTAALNTLSLQEGATLFMTLLAAFKILLYRHTGQTDIVVGTDIANRTQVELEPLIGFFVNVLALRTNMSGEPAFRKVLQQVREVVLGAYTHQDLPFDKLIEAMRLERGTHINQIPLIRALFVLQNISLEMEGIIDSLEEIRANTTRFHLAVFLREEGNAIVGYINYHTRLFDESTITTLIKHYQILLASIVAQPDALIDTLEIYSEDEKQQIHMKERAFLESTRRKLKKQSQGNMVDLSSFSSH